jgi:hypothetical protein
MVCGSSLRKRVTETERPENFTIPNATSRLLTAAPGHITAGCSLKRRVVYVVKLLQPDQTTTDRCLIAETAPNKISLCFEKILRIKNLKGQQSAEDFLPAIPAALRVKIVQVASGYSPSLKQYAQIWQPSVQLRQTP